LVVVPGGPKRKREPDVVPSHHSLFVLPSRLPFWIVIGDLVRSTEHLASVRNAGRLAA
jgi:hypothetical protein